MEMTKMKMKHEINTDAAAAGAAASAAASRETTVKTVVKPGAAAEAAAPAAAKSASSSFQFGFIIVSILFYFCFDFIANVEYVFLWSKSTPKSKPKTSIFGRTDLRKGVSEAKFDVEAAGDVKNSKISRKSRKTRNLFEKNPKKFF